MRQSRWSVWCSITLTVLVAATAGAQTLDSSSLAQALQHGGYVIVMRHASSPQTPPGSQNAGVRNNKLERQLDQAGIDSAKEMGAALRRLHIPIGTVYSSPTFRALETVRYAELGAATTVSQLGDHGMSMSGVDAEQTEWLRAAVKLFEPRKNVFIVTHMPNILAAFPGDATGLKDGEALVFGPDGHGESRLVAHVGIEQWSIMASQNSKEQ